MPRLAFCLTFAVALTASTAVLAAPDKATPHPDVAGVWQFRYQDWNAKGPPTRPELTEAVKAANARRNAAREQGYVRTAGNMLCMPQGGPSLFTIRSPFVIMEGLGRVVFIFETEGSNQPRSVYMREKAHPQDIYPSPNGHSIGHWEGKTLVVDTIGFIDRGQVLAGVPKTTDTHVVERFNWTKDGKVMTADITIEDPHSLVKPYTVQLVFDRLPDSEERFQVWCDVDLDAFATLDLPALKDADPDIARLLDVNQRPSDPALKIAPGVAAK